MRIHLLAPMLLMLLLAAQATPPYQTKPQSPNAVAEQQAPAGGIRDNLEEGIKHVLVSQVAAWNHGDLEGFMQGYWHSPDLTFFSGGTITKGWEPTLERYRQHYKAEGKEMGKLEFQDLHIELLSARAAMVTGK